MGERRVIFSRWVRSCLLSKVQAFLRLLTTFSGVTGHSLHSSFKAGAHPTLSHRKPDEEFFAVLEDRRQTWDDYDGDDADAVDAMIKRSPAAADDELAQRYSDYSSECYAILREPAVWSAIERIAAKLIEGGKLSAAEALAAIGGDAARLHP